MPSNRVIKGWLTGVVLVAATSLAPAAQAVVSPPDPPVAGSGASYSAAPAGTATTADSGFQWDDAVIGAAGAVVLVGASAGASGALRRRRAHRAAIG